MTDSKTSSERFVAWVGRRGPVVIVLFAAALTGALFEVAHGVNYVNGRIHHRWMWRGAEMRKVESLEAGMTEDHYVAVLGPPVFSRDVAGTKLHEYSFRGRGYWVQAIANSEGTVDLFAVTSCDSTFHPRFRFLG